MMSGMSKAHLAFCLSTKFSGTIGSAEIGWYPLLPLLYFAHFSLHLEKVLSTGALNLPEGVNRILYVLGILAHRKVLPQ